MKCFMTSVRPNAFPTTSLQDLMAQAYVDGDALLIVLIGTLWGNTRARSRLESDDLGILSHEGKFGSLASSETSHSLNETTMSYRHYRL